MFQRLRASRLLWPSLFLGAVLPMLIALGAWQWSRMHWKQALLHDLKRASNAPAKPLEALAVSSPGATNPTAMRFRRVTVIGVFEHEYEMHVWSPLKSGPGWRVVTPLRLSSSIADKVGASHLLAIRGVVPAARKSPGTRKSGQVKGARTVTGRIRIDRPNTWANQPNIEKNEWFTRDVERMAAHVNAISGSPRRMLPYFIELEQQIGGRTAPEPDLQALTLSNRHFEYALTWWGLAATLVGVFVAFAWGRRDQSG